MLLWTNLSEIVVLNKPFVTTKDDDVAGLERDNAELQNTIVGLIEELEHTKAANKVTNDDFNWDNVPIESAD